ncbi:MAG: hypothetical protein GXO31_05200 [Epsilonproteobacteria bacterium]|nr:hypothetical protein [Campylobacterota bacterium]
MAESIEDILLTEDKVNSNCISNLLVLISLPITILIFISIDTFRFSFLSLEKSSLFFSLILLSFSIYFYKKSPFYIVCDAQSAVEHLKNLLKEKIEKQSFSIDNETKSIGDLKSIVFDFKEKYKIDIRSKILQSLTYLSVIFLGIFYEINLKNISFLIFYALILFSWQFYWENRLLENIEHLIEKIENEFTEKFWEKNELKKYEIIQNEILSDRIQKSFNKAFDPKFIKNLEYTLKSQIEALLENIKKEKDFQDKLFQKQSRLLENYKNMEQKQLEALNHIKASKENSDLIFKNIQKINSSLEDSVDKLSKEIRLLNVVTLNTFEKISNSINRFEESYENISKETAKVYKVLEKSSKIYSEKEEFSKERAEDISKLLKTLNLNIEILNKNFDILESIFSHYQWQLSRQENKVLVKK